MWEEWKTFRGAGGTRCDVRGVLTFDEMQRTVFRCLLRDGDIGAVLVNANGQPMIQGVMGDYIESPPGKQRLGMSVDGVEMDRAGRPISFWVKGISEKLTPEYFSTPSRDFIFMANTDSLDEMRGMSRFNQGGDLFDLVMSYLESSAVSARAASFFSLLIKRENASNVFNGLGSGTNTDGDSQKKLVAEMGSVQYMRPGESVEQIKPEQPIQGLGEAIATFCRFTGLKFGLPIEEVLLDYSRANYTVSRAIKMKIQRVADIYQQNFANAFVSRVYHYVISMKINAGEFAGIDIPDNNWKHEWIPQPLPLVDPGKEIEAAKAAIELGVETRSYVARGMGYKFETLCEQNRQDRELLAANDLPINDQPSPQAAIDPNATDSNPEIDQVKAETDAYGVAVRAGAITPQTDDENEFRKRMKLPAMTADAQRAWSDDKGVRRPITLVSAGDPKTQAASIQASDENNKTGDQ